MSNVYSLQDYTAEAINDKRNLSEIIEEENQTKNWVDSVIAKNADIKARVAALRAEKNKAVLESHRLQGTKGTKGTRTGGNK